MDFWLITNGEKSGPFPDYVVRTRISHGDLDADSRIWYEGLPEWTKIGESEIFKGEFPEEKGKLPPQLPPEYLKRAEAAKSSEPKPKKYLVRRFWARWLDLSVYASIWWLGMYVAGQDIGAAIENSWLLLPMYLPWFMYEAWLLHQFGTTPGKWLMSLKVVNEDDGKLSLKAGIWRSIRVMISGIGFGWPLLSVLCQSMSWFTTRRIGKPIWDFLGQHKVVAGPLNPFRVVFLVVGFAAAFQLQMAVRGPHERENILKQHPQMEQYLDKGDGWYFPVRK
ncbi:RDD family protein [Luteolibacter sp. AS25]|uniref:RDD family protein n=1 Tax=Luteolibacter sp. AS25 TaxID=3135776 RepID=UPI00398B6EF0